MGGLPLYRFGAQKRPQVRLVGVFRFVRQRVASNGAMQRMAIAGAGGQGGGRGCLGCNVPVPEELQGKARQRGRPYGKVLSSRAYPARKMGKAAQKTLVSRAR